VNFEKAEVRVAASLQEGVDLRLKVAGQYARHGLNLYDGSQEDTMALLWVLNLSDGDFSLLDIAERAKMPFVAIKHAANRLSAAGLAVSSHRAARMTAEFSSPGASPKAQVTIMANPMCSASLLPAPFDFIAITHLSLRTRERNPRQVLSQSFLQSTSNCPR
jgi:winged helix-turn-helix protein